MEFPAGCSGAHTIGESRSYERQKRKCGEELSGFSHSLERRRPRPTAAERSQGGIRQVEVAWRRCCCNPGRCEYMHAAKALEWCKTHAIWYVTGLKHDVPTAAISLVAAT